MVTRQLQVKRRTGKVRRQGPTFYRCAYAINRITYLIWSRENFVELFEHFLPNGVENAEKVRPEKIRVERHQVVIQVIDEFSHGL